MCGQRRGLEMEWSLTTHTEAIFTANHLTDTYKQNSTAKYTN